MSTNNNKGYREIKREINSKKRVGVQDLGQSIVWLMNFQDGQKYIQCQVISSVCFKQVLKDVYVECLLMIMPIRCSQGKVFTGL